MAKKPSKTRSRKTRTKTNPGAEIVEITPPVSARESATGEETTGEQTPAENIALVRPVNETPHEEPGEGATQTPDDYAEEEDDLEAVIEDVPFGPAEPEEEPESLASEIEEETAAIEEVPGAEAARTPAELKAAIECLLFTTPHALSLKKLRALLPGCDIRTLRGAVSQLQMEYDARAGGLQIIESAEGYQMCTRPRFADAILRLHQQRKRNPLTMTALETLAIVAYKQPITRAEIEMIRGVESSGVLRNLCDMGLVKVVGRKEVIGRPQLYGATSVFLTTFGLRTLADLPAIEVLRRQFSAKPAFQTAPETAPETGERSPDETAGETAAEEENGREEEDEAGEGESDESSGDEGQEMELSAEFDNTWDGRSKPAVTENGEEGEDMGKKFFDPDDEEDFEEDEEDEDDFDDEEDDLEDDDEDWELDEDEESDEDEDE